jgi:hypothetical protein
MSLDLEYTAIGEFSYPTLLGSHRWYIEEYLKLGAHVGFPVVQSSLLWHGDRCLSSRAIGEVWSWCWLQTITTERFLLSVCHILAVSVKSVKIWWIGFWVTIRGSRIFSVKLPLRIWEQSLTRCAVRPRVRRLCGSLSGDLIFWAFQLIQT